MRLPPILIIGSSGQVGTALAAQLGADAVGLTRSHLDLTEFQAIEAAVTSQAPRAVINCAAFTAVDRAESESELAAQINYQAVAEMARVTSDLGIPFVTYSTDYVFDGTATEPYVESDPTNPQSVYGQTKLLGEQAALAAHPGALIIRTSWVISRTHDNFVSTMLRLAAGNGAKVVDDQWGRPTSADDLATATLDALDAGLSGILHLSNTGEPTTWFRLARTAARLAGLDETKLEACTTGEFPRPAPRPAWSVLGSATAVQGAPLLQPWTAALEPIVFAQIRRIGEPSPGVS